MRNLVLAVAGILFSAYSYAVVPDMEYMIMSQNEGLAVSRRQPYDGFEWKELSGAGLRLWVQENEHIRLLADPSLPGIVMVRDGDASPMALVRIFDLPNNDIDDVLQTLGHSDGWDAGQTCAFREVNFGRSGVRRFVLAPAGEYGSSIAERMKTEPVPSTCNGWGTGNSGIRYFEIHEDTPGKALFVEIGQDAPLFDENSIEFADNGKDPSCLSGSCRLSGDELLVLSGVLRIGHEVRSFIPDGSDEEFWIVDRTGQLVPAYDKVTSGQKNGTPVRATLKLEYDGVWDDGFAAEYSGTFLVREVIQVEP